jgi:hypothetical protein
MFHVPDFMSSSWTKVRIDMTNPEAPARKPRCQFISKNGSRCHADPQAGKDWCFFHDPEQKKKQAEARKQGGEARTRQTEPEIALPPNLSVLSLKNGNDIRMLMAETINDLRCGNMDLRAARTIGYLAGLHLRALKRNYSPVAMLMEETINQFRRREIDLPTAKTFGMLASVMLCAVKQEDQERKAAAIMETEAAVLPKTTRPAEATRAQAPRQGRITPIVAAQALNDCELHSAVINGNAGNTADRGGIQIPQPLSS